MNNMDQLIEPPSFMRVLRDGWKIQSRVIGALILREMQTRYGRENIGYLWALIEPLILMSMFIVIFRYRGITEYHGMNLISFMATGVMTFVSLRKISTSISGATDANQGLLLYPQVTPLDTMLARIVLESATFLVVFSVIIGGGWLLDLATLPHDLLGVLVALFAVILLGVSLGVLQNVILTLFPLARHILKPLWRFLIFTSCVFYSLRDLPISAQKFMEYNPIAHLIELLRTAFFLNFQSPIHDYWYVLKWSIVCLFIGLLVERMYRYRDVET